MKILVALFFTLVTTSSFADARTFDRTWLGLMGKKQINESGYSIWTEVQARMDNDEFVNQQLLMRWGLLKKTSDAIEVGLIYGYIFTGAAKENRPTLQFAHVLHKTSENVFSIRHRFEYRKREDLEAVSGRYRAQIRYQRNLENHLSLIAWDEPFINITREDWTGRRLLERNRLFIGTGIPFAGVTFEVGYMHQYTPRTLRDIHEHILTVYLIY